MMGVVGSQGVRRVWFSLLQGAVYVSHACCCIATGLLVKRGMGAGCIAAGKQEYGWNGYAVCMLMLGLGLQCRLTPGQGVAGDSCGTLWLVFFGVMQLWFCFLGKDCFLFFCRRFWWICCVGLEICAPCTLLSPVEWEQHYGWGAQVEVGKYQVWRLFSSRGVWGRGFNERAS